MLPVGVNSSSKEQNWFSCLRPPSVGQVAESLSRSRQSGNIYITSGNQSGSTTGNTIFKFDKDGNNQWQKYLPYSYSNPFCSIAIDSSENVYSYTQFSYSGYGNTLGTLSKLNSAGDMIYQKGVFVDTTKKVVGTDIILSSDNNYIFCVGNCQNDTFFLKYSLDGTLQVQKNITNSQEVKNSRICTDQAGNIYISSSTAAGVTILKFNSSYSLIWQRYISGINSYDIKADKDNNIYLACYTYESPQTNPNYPISMTAVLVKYDTDGSLQWQKQITQSNKTSYTGAGFSGIAISDDGLKIYCSLVSSWSMSYPELSFGTFSSGAGGLNETTIVRFDNYGNYDWSFSYGTRPSATRGNQSYKIEIDQNNTLYVATTAWLNPTPLRYAAGVLKLNPQITHNESSININTSTVTPHVFAKGSNARYTYGAESASFSESVGSASYSDGSYSVFNVSDLTGSTVAGTDVSWKVIV